MRGGGRGLVLVVGVLLSFALALPVGATPADPDASRARRSLTVVTVSERSLDLDPVPRTIVGGNLRWLDDADGAWNPRRRRIRTDVARVLRRAGIGSIRYAGGTVANLFDHRRALRRPGCQTSGGFAAPPFVSIGPRRSGYTIPQHARFARSAGAATNLMVPMVNTTVGRARDFVRRVAAATGQSSIVVEIGNEPFLPDQRYWRSFDLDRRLDEYIGGGSRLQGGAAGDDRLYRPRGCDLAHPARADGRADQSYRTRYSPISLADPPVVVVDGRRWHHVADLRTAGPRERAFTVRGASRIVFGDGRHGARPEGAMRIRYIAGPMLGYADLYRALHDIDGLDVTVCSAWATRSFVWRMADLGLPYDCLAVHQYGVIRGSRDAATMFDQLMRAARGTNAALARLRAAANAAGTNPDLIVTEFGAFHRRPLQPSQKFAADLVRAVEYVGQLQNGVRISDVSNFDDLLEQYQDRVTLSSSGHLARLIGGFAGRTVVAVDGLPTKVEGVAARRASSAAILLVNSSWSTDRSVAVALPGRPRPTCVRVERLAASPEARTRAATSAEPPTSLRRPRDVVWLDGRLRVPLPAHSVTVLRTRAC